MAQLQLEVVTPERKVLSESVDMVTVPGLGGELGILPGHTPLLATLQVGELWYRQGQEKHYLSIAFGFVEVQPDRVTILARLAERAEDIDVERAEEARRRAEQRLSQSASDFDYERARVALTKSLMRLQVSARLPGGARVGELKRIRDSVRG